MLRRMSIVHAVSEATADDVVKYAEVPRARVRVACNGISLATPSANQAAWPRPFLIYPARLEHPGKNHLRLLEGFSRSKARLTHDLIFSGKDWGAQERIEQTIRTLGLDGQVSLLGFVSREELVGRMAESDAVIVAGLFEGFGLQAAEALALGRPLAYAAAGSLPEVAGGHGASFDPLDVASIAEALDKVVADDAVRSHCRTSGPVYAERFSWDATAASIADALMEVSRETS
jgi:glycosyltransferase involved in cell wall biosynthesis